MARRKRLEREEESQPVLDISSLIDVSFLLLIYFLVTSTLQPREVDTGLSLPTDAPPVEVVEQRPLELQLNPDGSVIADPDGTPDNLGMADENYHFGPLRDRLVTYKGIVEQSNMEPFVVLRADDNADHQKLMNVLNTIAGAGIDTVTLTGFTD